MNTGQMLLEAMSEKEWELQAVGTERHPGIARQLGYTVYHTLRSKGSQPGYPDWTLARDRVVFLELKRMGGKPSPAQCGWIRTLLRADAEAYIAWPDDLQDLATVLSVRGDPSLFTRSRGAALRLNLKTLQAIDQKGAP